MQVVTIEIGAMGENCYIVSSERGNAVVIDPGGDADRILRKAEEHGWKIQKILLTHGHFDHVSGVKALKDATGAEIYIHSADQGMLTDPRENLAALFGMEYLPVSADTVVSEGEVIALDELSFTVLHTPGHTPGSVCYLAERTLFSGDTLFAGSIGRTDFPNGSDLQLSRSLQRLAALEGDYTVLSGHGEKTALEWERKSNPYLQTLRG